MALLSNQMQKLAQKHSIFAICLISYLFILGFSIMFNIYNHIEYIKEFREQKRMYDMVMFGQLDEMINGQIKTVDALLTNVLTDNAIIKAVSADNIISSSELSKTLNASIQMRNHNKESVSRLYIYFNNNDAIIMDGAYYRPMDFYGRFVDRQGISFSDWHTKQMQGQLRDCERSDSGNPNELAFYHAVKAELGKNQALIVILLNLEPIFTVFKDSFFSGEMAFRIFDDDNNLLVDFGRDEFEAAHRLQTAPFTSPRTGWTYLSAIPQTVYDRAVNNLLQRTTAVLLVELAVGFVLCVLFARTNSVPMRALYTLLTGRTQDGARKVKNEYGLVSSYVETLIKEKDKLLAQHEQVLKNNLLLAILNNSITRDESDGAYMRSLGMDFPGTDFKVVNIIIEYGDTPAAGSLEDKSLMKYYLIDLLTGTFINSDHPAFADVSWNQTAVIFNGKDLDKRTGAICQHLNDIKRAFEKQFDVSLVIGVGNAHCGLAGAAISQRESVAALEYSILKNHNSVYAYRDISGKGSGQKFYYPSIDRSQLKAKIRVGDSIGATSYLDEIFADIFSEHKDIPLEVAKCLFFEIMGMGLEVLAEIKFGNENSDAEYMELLFVCQSIGQLKKTLSSILNEICGSIKNAQNGYNQQLLERINRYVSEHYLESNFSMVSLSDHLGITPPYLSSYFKEKTGENLIDRILRLRMEAGKSMLHNTGMKVAEIATAVGYTSSGTFIRSFKRLVGITPTQYRQTRRESIN